MVPAALHVLLLRLFRRMPTWMRRRIVRTISPSFTVGSMCFIEDDGGRILMVQQVYRTRWGVPGGLLKRNESAADAARREVFEEVGLTIELEGEPCVVVDPDPQRVDVIYRATLSDVGGAVVAAPRSPEITEVGWFAFDDLPELQAETVAALAALGLPWSSSNRAR